MADATVTADKEYTYQDVAEHSTKKDILMVIHDQVYDCTKFVDEHPGGEEVMLDLGGQDASEAFEDVGHSDEARDTLSKLKVGALKRQAGDPVPSSPSYADVSGTKTNTSSGMGIAVYGAVVVGGALAYLAYNYMQAKQEVQV